METTLKLGRKGLEYIIYKYTRYNEMCPEFRKLELKEFLQKNILQNKLQNSISDKDKAKKLITGIISQTIRDEDLNEIFDKNSVDKILQLIFNQKVRNSEKERKKKLTQHYTIIAVIENELGVLTRLTGLFFKKGFKVSSLAIGQSEVESFSRITFTLVGNKKILNQFLYHLQRSINIKDIVYVSNKKRIERELLLIKIKASAIEKKKLKHLSLQYQFKIIETGNFTVTLEITGKPKKIKALCYLIQKNFRILQIVRTGKIALLCDDNNSSVSQLL